MPLRRAPTSDAALQEKQVLKILDKAISELPNQLKEPLILTSFQGLSQKEAGELLGISPKAIETRVYRARAALLDVLKTAGVTQPVA